MKRVYIIHGWEAGPDCNWFPWLKNELVEKGIEAYVPAMPNSAHPKCNEWVAHLKKTIGAPDKETILVGHSLGTTAILRYLEALPVGKKIGRVILVSGFSEPLKSIEEYNYNELNNSFLKEKLDYDKIKNSAEKFIAIHSDSDPYVPLHYGEILKEKLEAELIIIHISGHLDEGDGHLNSGDGSFRFPLVLKKALE